MARAVIKKGQRRGLTRYYCQQCHKSFSNQRRPQTRQRKIWQEYIWFKQTKPQLREKLLIGRRKLNRLLDTFPLLPKVYQPRPVVVIIDATYFSRKNGVLVARDPLNKENLHAHEIVSETKEEYRQARADLEQLGYTLLAVVLDGRTGIPRVFEELPVQICHWHQWQIVRRKLTLKPKLPSHQALFSIGRQIGSITEDQLGKRLDVFQKCFRKDLEEKTYTWGTNRWRPTHAKLRSAYNSLRRNLSHLYTYQKYPELKIPNTTNSLDGSFNALKSHINVHRGLNKNRRAKIIKSYLRL